MKLLIVSNRLTGASPLLWSSNTAPCWRCSVSSSIGCVIMRYPFCSKMWLMPGETQAAGAGADVHAALNTSSRGKTEERHLVEVAEAHPLDCRRLPFGQRGDKLHGGRLLLQHPQRQRAQHGVALVYESLGGGAGVDRYHFAACRTRSWSPGRHGRHDWMRSDGPCARTRGRVADLSHRRVQFDVQALGQRHGNAGVAVPHSQVAPRELKVIVLCRKPTVNKSAVSTPRRKACRCACACLIPVLEREGGEGCSVGKLQVGKVPV